MKITRTFSLLVFIALLANHAFAQDAKTLRKTSRPVHTYSIVARDPESGQMGVAVQSHWFSVGSIVTWAEAGVGAVATQSLVDVTYGPLGLDLMRAGRTAEQALEALKVADQHPEIRQVAMIDTEGNVAAHTGKKCIPDAGHIVGDNFSVQANLMLNDKVWPAMKEAYESTPGDLADKMLASLEAAQSAGGDIRGKQSAAILIVRGESTGKPWEDRVMELRIEDHPNPIQELKRLVRLHRAYEHMNKGDLAIERNDVEAALEEYGAAEALFPENLEMKFWHAVSLVNAGRTEESLSLFKEIFAKDENWVTLVQRLPKVDILPKDESIIKKILSVAPGNRKKAVK
ncbi:DUF1028 domain-containing protein [candidate division KSB1 bacterium]|nr:DUF1028 domain-containing protein [candidate division KSB1 bacterium]NIR72319.1 DUF1028 domain-containing protein [candidate division KSB1 bacterium]NIS26711.1 DUF1028 domain-containing protein [candidate division KSB1 bacterium]NIT73457.1 DUF1028 domain-containing protein [candidate division KSB1 bacterium]NIU27326.1 DUF1028 domain-containing protein [candidate division KSB1 bacterium]